MQPRAPLRLHSSVKERQLPNAGPNSEHLLEIDVLGDGNCMFYSIAFAYLFPVIKNHEVYLQRYKKLFGSTDEANAVLNVLNYYDGNPIFFVKGMVEKQLASELLKNLINVPFRRRIVKYMRDNHIVKSEFIPEYEGNVEDYLQAMAQPTVWGGPYELLAASQVLGVHIQVYKVEQDQAKREHLVKVNEEYGEANQNKLYLIHHDESHYHYLIKPESFDPMISSVEAEMERSQAATDTIARNFAALDESQETASAHLTLPSEPKPTPHTGTAPKINSFSEETQVALNTHFLTTILAKINGSLKLKENALDQYLSEPTLPSTINQAMGKFLFDLGNNVLAVGKSPQGQQIARQLAMQLYTMAYIYFQEDKSVDICLTKAKQIAISSDQIPLVLDTAISNQWNRLVISTTELNLETQRKSQKFQRKVFDASVAKRTLSPADQLANLVEAHARLFSKEVNAKQPEQAKKYEHKRKDIEAEMRKLADKFPKK